MPKTHRMRVGGRFDQLTNYFYFKKRSQKILSPTLLQHGCLLTSFLADLKILGGVTPPRPQSAHPCVRKETIEKLSLEGKVEGCRSRGRQAKPSSGFSDRNEDDGNATASTKQK